MRNIFERNLLLNHQVHENYRNLVLETNLANVAVLFVENFSLDSGKIDFPIQISTIRMGFRDIHYMFKGVTGRLS